MNPAVAARIVPILLTPWGGVLTGWLMEEPGRAAAVTAQPQLSFPTSADEDGFEREAERALREIHETRANLLLLPFHVGDVVLDPTATARTTHAPRSRAGREPQDPAMSPDLSA